MNPELVKRLRIRFDISKVEATDAMVIKICLPTLTGACVAFRLACENLVEKAFKR